MLNSPAPGPGTISLPAGYPLPVARRRRSYRNLIWGSLIAAMVLGLIAMFVVATIETGASGFLVGLALSAIPIIPVVSVYIWLDSYEAEPRRLLALAFAWGAGVATAIAMAVNTSFMLIIHSAGGPDVMGPVVVAPVVEETAKGLGLLMIIAMRRREFDGIVDGLVYAGMVGLGFAVVEDVLYLGRAFSEGGVPGAAVLFLVRCAASPFAHPLFTSATGIGLGLAMTSRHTWVKIVAPVCGWIVAVGLHATWNSAAVAGLRGFLTAYLLLQVPIFLGMIGVALFARYREGQLLRRHLSRYAEAGWFTPAELGMLVSLKGRRQARVWAQSVAGKPGRRAMASFQELATEAAFLRERMVRGTAPHDAAQTEYGMLTAMTALRQTLQPAR